MPFIRISYLEGQHSADELKAISKNIHDALVDKFKIPPTNCFQVFHAHKSEEFYFDREYAMSNPRTDKMIFVQIACAPGRTTEVKKELYAQICDNLCNHCGFAKQDVHITLLESERENWSLGEGLTQLLN